MIKKELLSPVGNFESLKQAVSNGADAVYLGGKKFGARAFADNFNEEEMVNAIKYCHLYDVKIYVTVNTMIYEKELEECLNYIGFLHQNNVDAVIMQDLGLIKMVRKTYPNLEIHASTQMHNHNQEQLKLLEKIGIKRVVLARELSLGEMANLNTNMETEAFIHGALCISYSGQCLFSSLLLGRSGNRGSCAGICRLPFKLMKENIEMQTQGEYLLSPKEFSTLDNFKEIMESNIYSLKIEGRMKSPAYVGFITKLYRNLIDNYSENKKLFITEKQRKELSVLFNRGFTKGHLLYAENDELINIFSSNHQGIEIGEVLEIKKAKIKIKLKEELNQEDGIRFISEDKGLMVNFLYNEKGLFINSAPKNSICYIDNKIGLKTKGIVLKTIDSKFIKELEKIKEKKIPIDCEVVARKGHPLEITFKDKENTITKYGVVVEKARSKNTEKEIIQEKISSLGNTPFVIKKIKTDLDKDVFISMSELKNMRRELETELQRVREIKIPHPFLENQIIPIQQNKTTKCESINLNVLIRSEEQLKACLEERVNTIYVTEEKLYDKYKHLGNIVLRLPRVQQKFKEYVNENLLIGETGALYKYGENNKVVTDYFFNVANSKSVSFLVKNKACRVTLSIENKIEEVKEIMKNIDNIDNVEMYLYGKPEVMILKHCPLKMLVNKERVCSVCKKKEVYFLKDRNGALYPIITNPEENHLTHIFYYKNIDLINHLEEYRKIGIKEYRVEFFKETKEEIKSILCKIRKCQI